VNVKPKILCPFLAKYGQSEGLKYAHENGCHWDQLTCTYTACNGHIECLKYLHENGCHWDANTTYYAMHNGHIYCLEYAVINKCPSYENYIDKLEKLKMEKNTN